MITAREFYAAFEEGFRPAVEDGRAVRLKGGPSKYRVSSDVGDVVMLFRVNPRVFPVPHQAGDFWPTITAPASVPRVDAADNGVVSWYQYTRDEDAREVQRLREQVLRSVADQDIADELLRGMRDDGLPVLSLLVDTPPEPRFPDTRLIYLVADDARSWGDLFARQLPGWLERFTAAPETLASYMWRVHWRDEEGRPAGAG